MKPIVRFSTSFCIKCDGAANNARLPQFVRVRLLATQQQTQTVLELGRFATFYLWCPVSSVFYPTFIIYKWVLDNIIILRSFWFKSVRHSATQQTTKTGHKFIKRNPPYQRYFTLITTRILKSLMLKNVLYTDNTRQLQAGQKSSSYQLARAAQWLRNRKHRSYVLV